MANKTLDNNRETEELVSGMVSKGESEGKRQALEIAEDARDKEFLHQSFAGRLFMGDFSPEMLFPFPEQPESDKKEADEFIDKLTSLLENELDPEIVDATREIPKELIKKMADLGVFAMKVPKEYGGLGFSQANYNRVVMKVASYCGSTAVLISAHQSIGVPQPLKMFGTEAQKRKYFPRFRQGAISAFALTELDVGSDPAQMVAEAKLSDDGSHYILNGEKLWCTNGTIADVIIVMAKTAPKMVNGKEKKQISAFIVEMNTPGVEVTHRCNFMGLNAIYNGLLKFTNVKIPKENLLSQEGRGLAMALSTVNVGRLTLPAACAGAAKQALLIARRWGKERVQWGMPIGLHEAGRNKISYIAATILAMEAMAWLTSSWSDNATADIRIEAAMAKLFCTESLWKITDMTMQLRGGRGYEKASSLRERGEPGYPVERMMRDCRINTILEGSSEIMKLFLAREAIDPHLKRAGPLLSRKAGFGEKLKTAFKLLGFYSVWYPKQLIKSMWGSSYPDLGALGTHFKYVEKYSHTLASTIFGYMARYREKLESRQMILGRLMEIGTELFAMAAVCSYAVNLQKKNPIDNTPIELADYFCAMARRRINVLETALDHNDDHQANEIAKKVINQEFLWLEKGIMDYAPKSFQPKK